MSSSKSKRSNSLTEQNSQTQSTNKTKSKCGTCKKVIKESGEAVECETCLEWFHLPCSDLTTSDLQTLQKRGVHWFCEACDTPLVKMESRVSKIEQEIANIKGSFDKAFEQQKCFLDKTYANVVSKFQEKTVEIQGSINKQCETIISKQIDIDKVKDEKTFR